ncbi:hypothetical protein BJ165DRAFT_1518080 [Panaeolus papilionaceus]|nr:hypothetical protein BJ165DRAFT_1518080 [Panaeolus papilionaceus]
MNGAGLISFITPTFSIVWILLFIASSNVAARPISTTWSEFELEARGNGLLDALSFTSASTSGTLLDYGHNIQQPTELFPSTNVKVTT